jgi:hypothetical protein
MSIGAGAGTSPFLFIERFELEPKSNRGLGISVLLRESE